VPDGTRFTCQGCARCCQGWTVPVERETVERLRGHDWGGEPFEPLKGGGYPFRIKLVEGRCFFLDAQNRCRIHTEISYDAKPAACKAFPLSVLEIEGRQHARLSYWCPTVVANIGRPLEQQTRWLKDTAAIPDRRTAPVTLDGGRELSSRELERIHTAIRRYVADARSPMRDRLAAVAALIRRLQAAPGGLESVIEIAEAAGVPSLACEGASGGHPSSGRRVLTLFLLHDRKNERWSVVPRLAAIVLFNAGVWPLYSRTTKARATWRALRRVEFLPPPDGIELLARYFLSKVESRRYLAGDVSLVKGFNQLIAAYAMVEIYARTRAAAAGRAACDLDDVRSALSATDLLVVEHPGLDPMGLHRRVTDAALGGVDVAADVLATL
jgi:Fe-S-cluster containining protein